MSKTSPSTTTTTPSETTTVMTSPPPREEKTGSAPGPRSRGASPRRGRRRRRASKPGWRGRDRVLARRCVGHQRGDHDRAALRHPPQPVVALLHAELGGTARVEVRIDEQDRACHQERQRGLDRGRVEEVVDPGAEHDGHLDAHGTDHRPGHRADAGDGHGEEDGEAGLGLVGSGHHVLLGVGEEHPGQAGDPARDGERRQPGARRVDGEGGGGALVVAQGDQHPAGPVPAEGEGCHHDQGQEHETDVVEGPVRRQIDPAVQHGAAEVRGQARRQDVLADPVVPVEDVVRHGVAEGKSRDGEIEALDAQRRQADDHGGDDPGEDADAQARRRSRCCGWRRGPRRRRPRRPRGRIGPG